MMHKLPCLLSMIAPYLFINGCSREDVVGILGRNITLRFTFNTSITNSSHFVVYLMGNKTAEYCPRGDCPGKSSFEVYSKDSFVFCHITNLTQSHGGPYTAALLHKTRPAEKSSTVHLVVQEAKSTNNVSRAQENDKTTEYAEDNFSSAIIAVFVIIPVVLLVISLPLLFWCRKRVRGRTTQQNSPPTKQADSVASSSMHEGAFAYSVLNFPKREVTPLDCRANNTEYVRVHHHPHQK
ncbi:uncharacterized protein LOC133503973 [Syngnathoides biaculeatus]|uniref:uncharacterized protein LOC133503973 n=1 Tax=Syngnathoides biaculeatus TaxID=300417 RepID=UPI002ADD74EB|nr:uncharacterized protein LOC133503973 [Syngnathoides biaculeatus]